MTISILTNIVLVLRFIIDLQLLILDVFVFVNLFLQIWNHSVFVNRIDPEYKYEHENQHKSNTCYYQQYELDVLGVEVASIQIDGQIMGYFASR